MINNRFLPIFSLSLSLSIFLLFFTANMENDLHVSKNIQDSVKREHDTKSMFFSTTPSATNAPKKNHKKPKKKKKRPKHRQTSTTIFTTTALPETPPSSTTTETWPTETSHWQLVAERLFGSPWRQSVPSEARENVAKARTNAEIALKPHTSIWEFVEQGKPKGILKTMNTERTPLLLDFPRESNAQSRSLSFGRINPYQPLRLHDSREFPTSLYDQPAGKKT